MPNTSLTKRAMRDEMRDFLGEGIVDVELQDRHIIKAIRDATRVFNRYRPLRAWAAIQGACPEVKKYNLMPINPKIAGVITLSYIDNWQIGAAGNYLDPFQYQKITTILGGETYGQIHSDLIYMKLAREVASAEVEWRGQWEQVQTGGVPGLWLYLDLRRPMNVAIEYSWYLDETPAPDINAGDDPTNAAFAFSLANVPEGDTAWFVNYITARCKQTLGRGLRKQGGIPNAEGGTDPLDGAELVAEGREDEERLIDEIKRKRRPLTPVFG